MRKSIARTIGEGTIWVSASSFLTKIVSLLVLIVTLRHLSIYEYGLAKLALSLVPLLGFFRLPGASAVVAADMSYERGAGNNGRAKGILFSYFNTQAVLGVMAWVLLFFGSAVVANYYGEDIARLVKVVSFSFLISIFRELYTILFQVELKFLLQSMVSFLGESAKLALVLFLFLVLDMGPLGFILAGILGELVALGVMLPLFVGTLKPAFGGVKAERVSFLRIIKEHGKWSVFSSYLNDFVKNIRLWIIKLLLTTEAVAVYSVAHGLLANTTGLLPLSQVIAPIIPRFAREKERLQRIIKKSIKYQASALILLGVVAAIFFPPVILILFPDYTSSIPLYRILLLSVVGISFGSIFTTVFFATKKQKVYFQSIVVKVLAMLILSPVFILLFGIQGVAYELVITMSVVAVYRYMLTRKIVPGIKILDRDFFTFDSFDRMLFRKLLRKLRLVRADLGENEVR